MAPLGIQVLFVSVMFSLTVIPMAGILFLLAASLVRRTRPVAQRIGSTAKGERR
jgi:hypothetical protein